MICKRRTVTVSDNIYWRVSVKSSVKNIYCKIKNGSLFVIKYQKQGQNLCYFLQELQINYVKATEEAGWWPLVEVCSCQHKARLFRVPFMFFFITKMERMCKASVVLYRYHSFQ